MNRSRSNRYEVIECEWVDSSFFLGYAATARLNARFTAAEESRMKNIFSLMLTDWIKNIPVLFRTIRKTVRK
jgi:hypothetical protein